MTVKEKLEQITAERLRNAEHLNRWKEEMNNRRNNADNIPNPGFLPDSHRGLGDRRAGAEKGDVEVDRAVLGGTDGQGYNLLTELWPPENTEEYWSKAVVRLNEVWNGSTDNPLLMKLLLLTHEYLGEAVKRAEEKEEHDKAGG